MSHLGYGYVLVFLGVGVIFLILALEVARLLRPSHPYPDKLDTYECGPRTFMPAWRQFNVRYYLFALLFVLFDVEMAFLYPWAVAFRRPGLGLIAVIEMVVFVAILAVGLIYAWRKGALEWE
ncbi:MAG: NADH-quinone oxidoreductase subunit A [Armatimonadota bacterium]|nr:MAG: NADH-quinone oxidoreductase subunit A [Armatimonadota bacterium]